MQELQDTWVQRALGGGNGSPFSVLAWRVSWVAKNRTHLKFLSMCTLGREPCLLLSWQLMGTLLPTLGPLLLLQMAYVYIYIMNTGYIIMLHYALINYEFINVAFINLCICLGVGLL